MADDLRYRIFLVIQFGIFILVMDTAATVIALPTLAVQLGSDLPTVQWVVVGNGLAIAALLVPMGRLGDIVGRRMMYLAGFALFVGGLLVCASAASVGTLIAGRVISGVGGAMTQGNSLAILAQIFGEGQRGRILGIQLGVVGVAGIAGPALGGIIIDALGWRALFYAGAVAGGLAMSLVFVVLRGRAVRPQGGPPGFDWAGAALSALFLLCFMVTLSMGSKQGWGSPQIALAGAASGVLLAAFVWREKTASAPMVDLSLFANPYFAFGTLGAVTTFMGITCMRFLLPFHLQSVQGYTPGQVGLIIVPSAIATALAGPLMGRAADRIGGRLVANAGLALCVLSLLALSRLDAASPLWYVLLATTLMTFSTATFQAPNSSSILDSVERRHYGVVGGFINLSRNSGNVLGVAAATAVVASTMASAGFAPDITAVTGAGAAGHAAFGAGASRAFALHAGLIGLLLLLVLWRVPRAPARA